MTKHQRALPLVALSLFLIAFTPAAYASTLTVTLNPTNKTALLVGSSSTTLILTYPENSTLSHYLNNYSSSVAWSGSFSSSSSGASVLQGSLEDEDHGLRVQSMNVSYYFMASGNATALVVNKGTNISAALMGVFSVENGTVKANLGWRSFHIPGELLLNLNGHQVEVNYVGSTMNLQLHDHPFLATALIGMFGGDSLWHKPTLDFSALKTPLSNWTRNYDSITNTTTYSKTINGESSLNVSANFNGQKYTLWVKSDPSASIGIQGYAVTSGDSLVIQRAPMLLNPVVWVVAGIVAAAAIGAVVYVLRRPRASAQSRLPDLPSAVK